MRARVEVEEEKRMERRGMKVVPCLVVRELAMCSSCVISAVRYSVKGRERGVLRNLGKSAVQVQKSGFVVLVEYGGYADRVG